MKFVLMSLMAALALSACGGKNDSTFSGPGKQKLGASSGSGSGNPGDLSQNSEGALPVLVNDICKNPFSQPAQEKLLTVQGLVRPKGNWVMSEQRAYMRSQYLFPDQATMESLSPKMIEKLKANMAKVNEIDVGFDLSKLDWKKLPTSATSYAFKLNCSTLEAPVNSKQARVLKDTPTEHEREEFSDESHGSQNLSSGFGYILDAQTLVKKIIAKMAFHNDGSNPTLQLEFPASTEAGSLLDAESAKIPEGVTVQFIKGSGDSFYFRIGIEQINSGKMSLSYGHTETSNMAPSVSEGESKDLVVPVKHLMIFQSKYVLLK